MSKYTISVIIQSYASKYIGEVECDTIEEYQEKADALWKSQEYESPTTNISNDFEVGDDWELCDLKEDELKYYKS